MPGLIKLLQCQMKRKTCKMATYFPPAFVQHMDLCPDMLSPSYSPTVLQSYSPTVPRPQLYFFTFYLFILYYSTFYFFSLQIYYRISVFFILSLQYLDRSYIYIVLLLSLPNSYNHRTPCLPLLPPTPHYRTPLIWRKKHIAILIRVMSSLPLSLSESATCSSLSKHRLLWVVGWRLKRTRGLYCVSILFTQICLLSFPFICYVFWLIT